MKRDLRILTLVVLLLGLASAAMGQSSDRNVTSSVSAGAPTNALDSGCSEVGGLPAGQPAGLPSDDSKAHGFDLTSLDRSVSPCADFYQFSVGGWTKSNPIPAAYPRWGSFTILLEHNQDVLHTILEDAAKDKTAQPGSNWQKIGDFYASCMDEGQIEAAGLKPLQPELERIAQIKDTATLQEEVARLQVDGVNAIFGFGSQTDFKDSNSVIAGVGQGGLGLPDRNYYTRDDEKSKKLREEYVQHLTNMFKLLGDGEATAAANAKIVMEIETRLAKASMPRVDLRDPDKIYHKMSVAQVQELAPNLNWEGFFKEIGAPPISSVNVFQPEFMKEVNAAWTNVPLADWKTYLRWHLVHAVATSLPKSFVEENFDFFSKKLTGTTEMQPRWRRCVQSADNHLGEDLGQFYVERAFPPEAKAKALAMVQNLIAALRADLSTLDWMSPATREQALKKLSAIRLKIGYPDKWRSYGGYAVDRGPFVANVIRGNEFDSAYDLDKIGKPVDRGVWSMTPPTVNAYYNSLRNEIVFPAGILQPPFYDPNRDDAMNYGGMGAVIGHELTHGFDDQGSKFDAQGNRNDWWAPEDLKNFQARGECIVKQFDSFEVEPGLHENGKLVEGESIADLGGLTIAYAALQKTLEGKPAPAPIDGFTADQRFFLAWAQVWEGNTRAEYARVIVNTNPHPLDSFRVNAPMGNMPAFAKAFDCGADSKMVRPADARCRIW
ncbi:MAG: M13 family metallopeptidase [Candidatus Acidiferrales bacterium]